MSKIKDIMTTEVECCTLLDNLYEAAVKMKEQDVGVIPIVDGQKLVGIVTDRDLVIRGYAEKRSGSSSIKDAMTRDVISCQSNTTVEDAAKLMAKHQIRRLPVVENDALIGIVSLGDLATNQHSDEKAGYALSEISENDTLH